MHTIISNTIKIINYNSMTYNWVTQNLVVDNPDYVSLKMSGRLKYADRPVDRLSKVYRLIDNVIEVPFGCLTGLWPFIKNGTYELKFNDAGDISIKDESCPFDLFDYQKPAVEFMTKQKGGVLVSACGSGKTVMGTEIIHKIGKKFLWLTHTNQLLEQTYKSMKSMYPNLSLGRVSEGRVDFGDDGTVATVQTLVRLDPDDYKDRFDVVVCDECAHVVGSQNTSRAFSKILDAIPARYKIGLTATPSRSDSLIKTMYMYLGMSKRGWFEPSYRVKSTEVKTTPSLHLKYNLDTRIGKEAKIYVGGKINFINLITALSNDKNRDEEILEVVKNLNEMGRTQILLCHRVNHCYHLYKRLCEMKIPAELITGKTISVKRDKIINHDCDWNVLVATYALLKEGTNIKELDTLHLVTPQVDEATTIQCAGRIERFLEDKLQPLIYDYVDVNIDYCVKAYNKRHQTLLNKDCSTDEQNL